MAALLKLYIIALEYTIESTLPIAKRLTVHSSLLFLISNGTIAMSSCSTDIISHYFFLSFFCADKS